MVNQGVQVAGNLNGNIHIVRTCRGESDSDGKRACDRARLVGWVEPVDGRPARAFHNLHELWAPLCESPKDFLHEARIENRRYRR